MVVGKTMTSSLVELVVDITTTYIKNKYKIKC
jgi:hypothetical protein